MGRIAGVTPEETKQRLLDAAAFVFERKGYGKATVAEIAHEAGVTTGAIYAHYSSKADLLADALRSHGDRATASLFPRGAKADAGEVLITLANELAKRQRRDQSLLIEALNATRRDPNLAEVLGDLITERHDLIAGVIAAGQADGVLADDVVPEVAARFALMLGLGSMLANELDLPPVDERDWETCDRRFIGAFMKEGETP